MISASRSYQRPLLYRWVYFLPILIFLTPLVQIARADGGIVICQQSSAPFTITVFATEMPLRPGIADLSVLVEPTEGHSAILDAQVLIELEHETGMSIRAEATLIILFIMNQALRGRRSIRRSIGAARP